MNKPNRPFASDLRDMAYVPRWAIARRNRQQYLAEHSYFVAVYADQIARMIEWKGDFAELLRVALYHDIDETITGDIPGPAKRAAWNKGRAEETFGPLMRDKYGSDVVDLRSFASGEVRAIVSAADSIDEVAYLYEEVMLGNTWVSPVLKEAKARLSKRWKELPAHPDLLDHLYEQYVMTISIHQMNHSILLKDAL